MSRQMTRLLRVRRLMEDMSRSEFARRRAEQTTLEARRDESRATALALRADARAVMEQTASRPDPVAGVWQRYLADSETSALRAEQWDQAAQQAAGRAEDAERQYLEARRSRMQAEILVREKMAAERLEQQRREQREIDDWFGMRRGWQARRAHGEDSPI